jgi:predicted nucleic acid-binding protein
MKMVLDSSVLAKLFFKEEGSDSAIELMEKGDIYDLEFISSDLVVYEIGNTIYKNIKGKKKDGRRFIELVFLLNIELVPIGRTLAKEAMIQSQKNSITFYDGVHVALSKLNDAILVTQDKELLKKIKNTKSIDTIMELIEKID